MGPSHLGRHCDPQCSPHLYSGPGTLHRIHLRLYIESVGDGFYAIYDSLLSSGKGCADPMVAHVTHQQLLVRVNGFRMHEACSECFLLDHHQCRPQSPEAPCCPPQKQEEQRSNSTGRPIASRREIEADLNIDSLLCLDSAPLNLFRPINFNFFTFFFQPLFPFCLW